MQIVDDIPYLEPLLFHLQNDENLKEFFSNKSFFMPKHVLKEATLEAAKKDCPAPRALWVLPENSEAVSPKAGCVGSVRHNFYVVVFIQCIRDTFEIVKRNNEPKLDGQYMELSRIRKAVKKSINEFERKGQGQFKSYRDITWLRDQNIYPDEDNFLTTAMHYSVLLN